MISRPSLLRQIARHRARACSSSPGIARHRIQSGCPTNHGRTATHDRPWVSLARRLRGAPSRYTLLAAMVLWALAPLRAQELPLVHYGVREGLPSAFVNALAMGADGEIWMAGSGGVVRYDGVEFRSWRAGDGLLENAPNDISIDSKGLVWIIFADKGIQWIDRQGRVFTLPDSKLFHDDRITYLTQIGDSTAALGKHGYYRVTREGISGPFHPCETGEPVDALANVPGMGRLIATEEGLFADSGGSVSLVPLPYDRMGGMEIDGIVAGADGKIWCCGHEGWVCSWDGESSVSHPLPTAEGRGHPTISAMALDRSGCVWLGSYRGLYRWCGERIDLFAEGNGLSSSWVNDVMVDRDGILWIATEAGLDKLSQPAFANYTSRPDLPVNAVWAVEEAPDRSVWLGTNNGIVVIDSAGAAHAPRSGHGLAGESVIDLEYAGGDVWVLGFNGVYRWSSGSFRSFDYAPFNRIVLSDLAVVGPSEVWVATAAGIYRLDPLTGAYSEHPFRPRGARDVRRIVPRSAGGWWALGSALWALHADGSSSEVALPGWLESGRVYSIRDEGGFMFLVTSAGLAVRDGDEWSRIELEGQTAFDAIRTPDGSFWIGCSGGIALWDGHRLHTFGFHDGVAVEECNTNAVMRGRDGRLWFAGKNVTVVDQDRVSIPPAGAPLVTEAQVGEVITAAPAAFRCSSQDPSVVFRFACPSFFNEQEMSFRYRLAGFESEWNPAPGRAARYTKLAAGHYTLTVQARQKNGDWSGPAAEMPLTVVPAWWQTTAAKVGLGVMLAGLGFTVGIWRVRHLEAQRRKLARLVAEQTVEIRQQRDHLAELATSDELTGLPNRRVFNERIELEFLRARRYGRPLSVMIFDIDHFKFINDSAGHAAGDQALRSIAVRGGPATRETDLLARWGGDEFVVLMPETDRSQAGEVGARLKQAVEAAAPGGAAARFTLSGGVATWQPEDDGSSSADLLARADAALYRSKQEGRNRITHERDS